MSRCTVHHPQEQPRSTNKQGSRPKKPRRSLRGRPQIIRSPSQRLRRVAPCQKTYHQPYEHHPPRPWRFCLQFPDVPSHESRESHRFRQAGPPVRAPPHADCPLAFLPSSVCNSVRSSKLSNKVSISSSADPRCPKYSRSSKSGNPKFVTSPGNSSLSCRACTSPAPAIASNTTRFKSSANTYAFSNPANCPRVSGAIRSEHSNLMASRSNCSREPLS